MGALVRSRRWVALALVVAAFATACVLLGRWQWNRHVDRDAEIALIEANYAATPVPLAEIVPTSAAPLSTEDEWRPVRLDGRYVADAAVLVRNRTLAGQAGFHVLVPFQLDSGRAIVFVDRGWIPTADDSTSPTDVPTPPTGDVTVVARLRHGEPPSDRSAPAGQALSIDVPAVATTGGLPSDEPIVTGAYAVMATETPASAERITTLPRPDVDPGSHLSYALQWWVFAIVALAGFVVLARRESTGPAAVSSRRRPSAEDEEDAVIAEQLGLASSDRRPAR